MKLFVLVRKDLSKNQQAVQAGHAVSEYLLRVQNHLWTNGTLIYLEVDEVYVQTVKTLGANKWQTITTIFIPGVLSKTFDDIIVLAPISWTYIIIAEMMNNTGGLGSLAYLAGRQSRADKAFAILVTVFIIGMILDKVFSYFDKIFFKFKYLKKGD